jgi:anti-sigma-K factor RskA
MRGNAAGLHTLVGAYVMDAVPEADRAAFEQHLTGCEPCRDEVRGLREATARLAAAAAIEPRPELRDLTLQAASRVRQLPPLVAREEPAGLAGRMARWRRLPRSGGGRRAAGWLRVPLLAAVALVVLFAGAAVGLGLHMSSMQHQMSATARRDHAIAEVLGANDAITLTAHVSTGGTATVVMSHRARALVFTANRLPALPASKAYELWLMGPAGPTAAGMLPAVRGGMSGPMVVRGLAPGDRLALTIEPVTGARYPSGIPIVLVGLRS